MTLQNLIESFEGRDRLYVFRAALDCLPSPILYTLPITEEEQAKILLLALTRVNALLGYNNSTQGS